MELLLDKEDLKYFNQDIYAKTGISVLLDTILNSEEGSAFKKAFDARNELLLQNPHNPVLKNALDFFLFNISNKGVKEAAKVKYDLAIKKIDTSNKELAQVMKNKIRDGSNIFVHSLNNNILDFLLTAAQDKKFSVSLVEHAPLKFGEPMAKKLKERKINTRLYPDMAIKDAVTSSDVCFIGGDAIIKEEGAIGKTGSSVVTELAHKYNIPAYFCLSSLKYDHDKTMQKSLNHEHEKKETNNYDVRRIFEFLPNKEINAYICEYGVFKPEHLVKEIKFFNNWMFI